MKSLQSTTRSGITKKILLALAVLILAGLATGAYLMSTRVSDPANSNDTKEVKAAPSELSEEDTKNKEEFVESNGKDTKQQELPKASSIKAALAVSQEGNQVVAQTKVYNVTDGTCTLTAKLGSAQTSKSAPIMYQSEYSTCAGFSIPVSELGSGTWVLTLSLKSGEAKGDVTKTLEVN